MKMFLNSIVLVVLVAALSSCGSEEIESRASTNSSSNSRNAEVCMTALVGDSACRPNLHYFFSFPDNFSGKKISVVAFATYSSRGSLLIYPSSEFACDALEYSGIEVFLGEKISQGVEESIEKSGVVRVLVTGKVSGAKGSGALPVIGRIDDASVLLFDGTDVILLKNPKEMVGENRDDSFFGKLAKPSCLSPRP